MRVQIGVHDAERVQLGHMVPSDLQGVTTVQSQPRMGEVGGKERSTNEMQRNKRNRGGRMVDEKQNGVKDLESKREKQKKAETSKVETGFDRKTRRGRGKVK